MITLRAQTYARCQSQPLTEYRWSATAFSSASPYPVNLISSVQRWLVTLPEVSRLMRAGSTSPESVYSIFDVAVVPER